MRQYYSLGMKLDEVIKDKNLEQTILENVRRCSKLVGKSFKVVFWHEGLSEKECENFVKRNEKLLFEVNTKITKGFQRVWFLIGENHKPHGVSRYSYMHEGDILNGIVQYLKIIKHIQRRENG
jgi:hypothetical protein|tara:strand:+ start:228 stop:596 length:369 start_codon:yes stop_codon:yes gene_type:complete